MIIIVIRGVEQCRELHAFSLSSAISSDCCTESDILFYHCTYEQLAESQQTSHAAHRRTHMNSHFVRR